MVNKPYRRGLVVGKFSPFHKGHEYLIDKASSQSDEIIIISYSRPEFPSCPIAIRESWLKSFAPNSSVLCVNAPMIEQWRENNSWKLRMPINSDQDDLHREFTYKLLSEKLKLDIDAVFTSESYGDGFAQYLSHKEKWAGSQVTHVCVDIDRITVPVSASIIRNEKKYDEATISKKILSDYQIQKVCLLGAESTGKSTLSTLLAKEYDEPLVEEFGRTLWERNNGTLTPDDLINICKVQTSNEDKAQLSASKYIFCDTSPLTTLCYSKALFNDRPRVLEAFSEQPYHYIFLCEPDFALVQDGTRKDEVFRTWQHNWYLEELRLRKIPFTRLHGSITQRLLQATNAINENYKGFLL